MRLSELESFMREARIVALNIHRRDGGFQVHVRHEGQDQAFRCAQTAHTTLALAVREHSEPAPDILGDLL